jgi:mannose-1-phosphate guanylyltransferase
MDFNALPTISAFSSRGIRRWPVSTAPMNNVPALVLAAGRSTRLAAGTHGRSKVLSDIGGVTVLERNLRWLAGSGITLVWINLHHRAEDVKAAVGDGSRFGLTVRYSEEPELLGTAGAFRALAASWTSTSLVVYGDNVSDFDLPRLLQHHREVEGRATIALFDPRTHANSGIAGGKVIVQDGLVVKFVEGAGQEGEGSLVSAAVYALEPSVLAFIPPTPAPDFGRDVFPAMLSAGEPIGAHVIEPGGYCFGIDTPESLRRTREILGAQGKESR